MKPALIILAAGMGSRYGGLKQLDPVGPSGETVLDYSVFDAHRAGFDTVVFVIRPDIEDAFRNAIGNRLTPHIEVKYAFQTLDRIPPGLSIPTDRKKPWGTAHAVLTAREQVNTPFAVINADDFYGAQSFRILGTRLQQMTSSTTDYCMVGFELKKTLSEFGTVSRGICEIDTSGHLRSVTEYTGLTRQNGNIVNLASDGTVNRTCTGQEKVSMNMWGFSPEFFTSTEKGFRAFITANVNRPKAEYYIPSVVSPLIETGAATVEVLPTTDTWFGVTYPDDKPFVVRSIQKLVEQGVYPEKLW